MHDSDNYSTVIIAAPTIRPKQDNNTIMLYYIFVLLLIAGN